MSRKNKILRAFLHQNQNPTIEQAWDAAWKHAQKKFHARSMQDMEEQLEIERDYSKSIEDRIAALESTNLYQQLAAVQAENEALRARVAELGEVAKESQDWDWISAKEAAEEHEQEFFDVHEMQELWEAARKKSSNAWLLRKQAEAVRSLNFPVVLRKMWSGGSVREWLDKEAQHLLDQASALERQSEGGAES